VRRVCSSCAPRDTSPRRTLCGALPAVPPVPPSPRDCPLCRVCVRPLAPPPPGRRASGCAFALQPAPCHPHDAHVSAAHRRLPARIPGGGDVVTQARVRRLPGRHGWCHGRGASGRRTHAAQAQARPAWSVHHAARADCPQVATRPQAWAPSGAGGRARISAASQPCGGCRILRSSKSRAVEAQADAGSDEGGMTTRTRNCR